jgi:hypothetical protein
VLAGNVLVLAEGVQPARIARELGDGFAVACSQTFLRFGLGHLGRTEQRGDQRFLIDAEGRQRLRHR